jgi:hypothetical protein
MEVKVTRSNPENTHAIQRIEKNFNKKTRGPLLTLPLGANFDPRGEVIPQG